jgi:hypothetical protein
VAVAVGSRQWQCRRCREVVVERIERIEQSERIESFESIDSIDSFDKGDKATKFRIPGLRHRIQICANLRTCACEAGHLRLKTLRAFA